MANLNDFARDLSTTTSFVVENIAVPDKLVRVFQFPIPIRGTRDLLKIRGVGEADIRASLLKGELRVKILAKEIRVVQSDIDLLQFNDDQKNFLQDAGVVNGLEVTVNTPSGNLTYYWREKTPLIGLKNGVNRVFVTPDKFINGAHFGNTLRIKVEHNGKELYEGIDYTVGESGGVGAGFDVIHLISFTPNHNSLLYCTYAIPA
jgi:hypothetical protein